MLKGPITSDWNKWSEARTHACHYGAKIKVKRENDEDTAYHTYYTPASYWRGLQNLHTVGTQIFTSAVHEPARTRRTAYVSNTCAYVCVCGGVAQIRVSQLGVSCKNWEMSNINLTNKDWNKHYWEVHSFILILSDFSFFTTGGSWLDHFQ